MIEQGKSNPLVISDSNEEPLSLYNTLHKQFLENISAEQLHYHYLKIKHLYTSLLQEDNEKEKEKGKEKI